MPLPPGKAAFNAQHHVKFAAGRGLMRSLPCSELRETLLGSSRTFRQRVRRSGRTSATNPLFSLAGSIGILGGLNLLCFEHNALHAIIEEFREGFTHGCREIGKVRRLDRFESHLR